MDSAFRQPGAELGIVEQAPVAGHDRIRLPCDRRGDDWSIVHVAQLDVELDGRQRRRKELQQHAERLGR